MHIRELLMPLRYRLDTWHLLYKVPKYVGKFSTLTRHEAVDL